MWPEDYTTNRSHGGFTDVQFLFDEEGAQHEQAGEASQNEVSQVRLVD